jgi:hypothetical protein
MNPRAEGTRWIGTGVSTLSHELVHPFVVSSIRSAIATGQKLPSVAAAAVVPLQHPGRSNPGWIHFWRPVMLPQ